MLSLSINKEIGDRFNDGLKDDQEDLTVMNDVFAKFEGLPQCKVGNSPGGRDLHIFHSRRAIDLHSLLNQLTVVFFVGLVCNQHDQNQESQSRLALRNELRSPLTSSLKVIQAGCS